MPGHTSPSQQAGSRSSAQLPGATHHHRRGHVHCAHLFSSREQSSPRTLPPSKAGLQSGGQGRLRLVTSSLTRVQKPAGPITGFLPILLGPWRETDERTWVLSSPKMAIRSSTLAWKIPWTEEPGRLQSMGLQSRTPLSDFTHSLTHSSL